MHLCSLQHSCPYSLCGVFPCADAIVPFIVDRLWHSVLPWMLGVQLHACIELRLKMATQAPNWFSFLQDAVKRLLQSISSGLHRGRKSALRALNLWFIHSALGLFLESAAVLSWIEWRNVSVNPSISAVSPSAFAICCIFIQCPNSAGAWSGLTRSSW